MPVHTTETLWPCHWERVYKLQVDFPLRHPEFYARAHPDISDCIVQYDEMQGEVRYYIIEFQAATEIPPLVRSVIRPDMLNWVQEAWWNQETLSCKQKINPNFLTDYFDIWSEWQLHPISETETKEIWTFKVECSLPVVGGFVANNTLSRALASHQRNMARNLEQLREASQTGD